MSNINVMRKNLGPVTAYKYAVSQGYTGTEQEFAALMASYATVAEEAEAAKDNAVIAKTAAEAAQAAAEAAAEQAEGAIEVDDTLSVRGRAADAKVTGDKIDAEKRAINTITGNTVEDVWMVGYYSLGSAATKVDINTHSTLTNYRCMAISCAEGDTFYVTAHGTNSARPFAFLSSADSDNNILVKASADELDLSEYKVIAPAGSAYAIFNASINNHYSVIKGELIKNHIELIDDHIELIDETLQNVSEDVGLIDNKIGLLFEPKTANATGELITDFTDVTSIDLNNAASAIVRNAQIFEPLYPGTSGAYGISITKNTNGTYTINGTATSSAWFHLNKSTRTGIENPFPLDGDYSFGVKIVSGSWEKVTYEGSTSALFSIKDGSSTSPSDLLLILDNGIDTKSAYVNVTNTVVAFRATPGVKYNNLTVEISLNKGNKLLPAVSYVAPTVVTDFSNILEVARRCLPYLWISVTPSTENITVIGTAAKSSDDSASIDNRTHIISANHRGYHNGYPENTLWAFAQSKIRGFDWIENDVRFTSDGVGVLIHDEKINRTARNADGTSITGDVYISQITYAQACEYDFGIYAGAQFAGTKIVTVEECVKFCKNVGLNILMEPKVAGTGTYCANIVKKYAMENNVIWISFGVTTLQEVNAILPKAKVGFVTTGAPSNDHIATAVSLQAENNSVFLDYNYNYSIDNVIDTMLLNNIGYGVYTLDSVDALASLNPYCFMITSNVLVSNKYISKKALDEWVLN